MASFFVSRVDSALDPRLGVHEDPSAAALQGRIAIANAKLAYGHSQQITASKRFERLTSAGAQPGDWYGIRFRDTGPGSLMQLERCTV